MYSPEKFAHYRDKAAAMLAKGFTAESHRKDAMDYARRAYESAMDGIGEALLKARDAGTMDDSSDAWRKMYYHRPDCHVWKPEKHAAQYAAFPEFVSQANEAAALRAAIKAATLQPKAPSKAAREAIDRLEHAMTCQICGRDILARMGRIAHHGYERPGDGYQTASCPGALELPFEVSRDKLGPYVDSLLRAAESWKQTAAAREAESVPLGFIYQKRIGFGTREESTHLTVTRDNFATLKEIHAPAFSRAMLYTFDDLKAREVRDALRQESAFRDAHKFHKARFDAWKQTHKWDGTAGDWTRV